VTPQEWKVTVRRVGGGKMCATRTVVEDLDRPERFREHLLKIARTDDSISTDGGEQWIGDFELLVHWPSQVVWQDPERVFRWEKE